MKIIMKKLHEAPFSFISISFMKKLIKKKKKPIRKPKTGHLNDKTVFLQL